MRGAHRTSHTVVDRRTRAFVEVVVRLQIRVGHIGTSMHPGSDLRLGARRRPDLQLVDVPVEVLSQTDIGPDTEIERALEPGRVGEGLLEHWLTIEEERVDSRHVASEGDVLPLVLANGSTRAVVLPSGT